jgi:hypothetical protein
LVFSAGAHPTGTAFALRAGIEVITRKTVTLPHKSALSRLGLTGRILTAVSRRWTTLDSVRVNRHALTVLAAQFPVAQIGRFGTVLVACALTSLNVIFVFPGTLSANAKIVFCARIQVRAFTAVIHALIGTLTARRVTTQADLAAHSRAIHQRVRFALALPITD